MAEFPRLRRYSFRLRQAVQLISLSLRDTASNRGQDLFDGYAFGEVSRLVHVAAQIDTDVVGQELQRDDRENGGEVIGSLGNVDDFVSDLGE